MATGGDIRLLTARLVLRALLEADRAEYLRLHVESRERNSRWLPAPPPGQTPEQAFETALTRSRAVMAGEIESWTGCRLVALLRGTGAGDSAAGGAIAGYFNLNNIMRGVFLNADAGWQVSPEQEGHGLAFEALSAVLDFAFAPLPDGLGLHRVQANVIPSNVRSRALAKRCGFREEGLAKQMLLIDGRWEDHVMHAKLADEHVPR